MRVVSEVVATGLSVVVDVVSAVTVLSSTGAPVITSLLVVGFSEVVALFEESGSSDFAPVRVSASDAGLVLAGAKFSVYLMSPVICKTLTE